VSFVKIAQNPFFSKLKVNFTVEKSSQKIWSSIIYEKNCQKKTITQEPEIRPIWSPWSEAARVLLKSTLHCSLAVAVVANVRQKNLLSD
jgi:hypothetical protein